MYKYKCLYKLLTIGWNDENIEMCSRKQINKGKIIFIKFLIHLFNIVSLWVPT